MEQAMVNFRIDKEIKLAMEDTCKKKGLNMSTALTIFIRKVVAEQRIPFEITADPFYNKANMAHLQRGIEAYQRGEGEVHEILTDEDTHD